MHTQSEAPGEPVPTHYTHVSVIWYRGGTLQHDGVEVGRPVGARLFVFHIEGMALATAFDNGSMLRACHVRRLEDAKPLDYGENWLWQIIWRAWSRRTWNEWMEEVRVLRKQRG